MPIEIYRLGSQMTARFNTLYARVSPSNKRRPARRQPGRVWIVSSEQEPHVPVLGIAETLKWYFDRRFS